jgi:CBS domain-containing protein
MLTVRDVMTPNVSFVCTDDGLDSAADLLNALAISAVPVRDRAGKFVGVLSRSDLMNPAVQSGLRHVTVADVMTGNIFSVFPEAAAIFAAITMARHGVHRVFVIDADGAVIGVVTALDLVRALARGASFDVDSPTESANPERRPQP